MRRDLASALIMEDDVDWDVRIKDQLHDFALASNALTQPLSKNSGEYADSTFPTPQDVTSLPDHHISFDDLPSTLRPQTSPYGDNWDILWLGHCGMAFPAASKRGAKNIPKGRVIQSQDPTVPPRESMGFIASEQELKDQYPDHTRVTHHASEGVCALGYAVTQAGARSLLYWLGLTEVNGALDFMLSMACEGASGKPYHRCLTTQPPIFNHYRAKGKKEFESDIDDHGSDPRENARSDNTQWGVKMNFGGMLKGQRSFVDLYPYPESDRNLRR